MTADELPVAVLGAGIAGLVAARELQRAGVPVRVFEAAPKIAGLGATNHDADGFTYDIGAHFITNRLAAAIGVSGDCELVKYYGESVLVDGKTISYPNGLLRHPRFVASALKARLARLARRAGARVDANSWFRGEYGDALAGEVALPLIEAWSGAPADQLAASVGSKIPSGIAQTVFLSAMAKATKRAVNVGYCWAQPLTSTVWHVYPRDGVAALCQHLADQLERPVELNSPVQRIHVEDEQVRAITVGGSYIPVRAVFSTAPINKLPQLVEGTRRLDRFAKFRYRPMVLVNLKMRGRDLLDDVVVWLPSGFPFFRLTETTQSMPWLAPADKTMILCDIGAELGDEHWSMDDEALGRYCIDHLSRLIPDAADRYLGCRVVRTPIAYPVYLAEYEHDRLALQRSTGVDGLVSIGRHGEFSHNLMEDVYWTTVKRVHEWVHAPNSGRILNTTT